MMLRTIQSVAPLPANRIRLAWDDGAQSVVDLTPVLAKGGVLALLTDPAVFNAIAVGARGRTLVWRDPEGDEIDLGADALWRLAHQRHRSGLITSLAIRALCLLPRHPVPSAPGTAARHLLVVLAAVVVRA
jgi:hypothetical protein